MCYLTRLLPATLNSHAALKLAQLLATRMLTDHHYTATTTIMVHTLKFSKVHNNYRCSMLVTSIIQLACMYVCLLLSP